MRAPIRLAIFIDDLIVGGTQTWLTLLVRALTTRGFEMRVYCMRALAHPENVRRLSSYATVEIIGESRLWAGVGLIHLARALRTWPADIVQTVLPTSDMIGRTLARLVNVPVIFSSVRGRGVDKPGWQRWLDRRTAPWAHAVVFNNPEGVPAALQHEGIRPHQVVYIPNAVEVTPAQRDPGNVRTELKTPPEAAVIGTVARLHPSKSQQDLLRAFDIVCRQIPNAVLWLIGDGPCRVALEREVQRLGLAAHVRMPGTRFDVRDILEAMDVFALPSRWEGMPNALMEAMAAGRPVVTSDIDGMRELVRHGETGWHVPPSNPKALAQTLIEILSNRERASQVGQAALAHIQERFSLDRMADAYAQLYREGLEKITLRRKASRP